MIYDENNLNVIQAILIRIIRETFFVISGIDFFQVEENKDNIKYAGIMPLHGDSLDMFIIMMGEDSLKTLTAKMLGINFVDVCQDDMIDAISEFSNVICGNLKAMLEKKKIAFKVTSPIAIKTSENLDFILKNKIKNISLNFSDTAKETKLKIIII